MFRFFDKSWTKIEDIVLLEETYVYFLANIWNSMAEKPKKTLASLEKQLSAQRAATRKARDLMKEFKAGIAFGLDLAEKSRRS